MSRHHLKNRATSTNQTETATLQAEQALRRTIELSEWDHSIPAVLPALRGVSFAKDAQAQRLADALRPGIDFREGYEGLEVSTTSYVGRVDVGALRIVITPKLPAMPLTQLLRYAYGLRDLKITDKTAAPTARNGLQELLASMLAAEVDELLHRGLARHYVRLEDELDSPRGSVVVRELARKAGPTEARLPCRYFERRTGWQLNRVLLSGVLNAARASSDPGLRQRLHRCADQFEGVTSKSILDTRDIDEAERGLTRLTAAYSSALSIIRLLLGMQGVEFQEGTDSSPIPGFLFDMNIFFERLLSRFLHDNLTLRRIEDQFVLRHVFAYAADSNPKRRAAPKPRPDFGLFERGKLLGFLDAKYRDCWERMVPPEWLYQASVYALASPARLCVLLYACTSDDACDQRIDVRQPFGWSSDRAGAVILRPVNLLKMATLVTSSASFSVITQRQQWANQLVELASTGTANSVTPRHAA